MRVDTGLLDGVRALRQENQLVDFTLKIDGQEFKAHKVVLASASQHFRAMFSGPLKESRNNMVELKDVTVKEVSQLLDVIYTGDKFLLENYQKEMLECPADLQVTEELQDGVGTLRRDDKLSDLILKVDGREFRVHKVVLASVSDYFHAMLCGSLKESNSDVVELNGISAFHVSLFLDFIYNGDNILIESNPKELLECGVYFQAPKITQYCIERLEKTLRVRNCLEILALFRKFSLDQVAQVVLNFLKANIRKVVDHYRPEDMTLQVMQVALQNWKRSEWELFQYLNSWIVDDSENREKYKDEFYSQIRYKLMTPAEISAVKETELYTNGEHPWKALVDKASVYHQLPFHQKVLDRSTQNRARHSKSVFVMDTFQYSKSDGPASRAHILCKPEKATGMQGWKPCPDVKPPPAGDQFGLVIEVNNFLIACSEADCAIQHWLIFDPRTLAWHEMAPMPRPRDSFAVVHHKKHIYVLGGLRSVETELDQEYMDTIEEYSLETGLWSSTKKLPIALIRHAACVFKNAIYVSGGRIPTEPFQTPRMDRLDLSSQKWESKAPLLLSGRRRTHEHHMFVMKIKMIDSIVVLFRGLTLDYYDPETDQWSHCDFSVPILISPPKIKDRSLKPLKNICQCSTGEIIAYGNTLFLLNMEGDLYCLCVKWIIPEEKGKSDIVQIRLRDDPMRCEKRSYWDQVVWGMMAFPPQSTVKVE